MFRPGLVLVALDAAAFHREVFAIAACVMVLYQVYVIDKTVVTREKWVLLMAHLQAVLKTSVVSAGLYLFLRIYWDFMGGERRNARRWHEHQSQHKRTKAAK
jgi:hypothetical protein